MPARRDFLRRLGGLVVGGSALAAAGLAGQQQEPLAGQGETGALRDPGSAGRPQERKTARDNDEFVKAVEHRLQCTCGCTLDIYTCRTTDFTCTYSPELHKEVLALQDEGKTADEIVAAFVAKYGEKVLMAPKPEGFNLAGYVVPGSVILLVGGAMFLILRRRTRLRAAAAGAAAAAPAATGSDAGPAVLTAAGGAPDATPDELERLNRELRELDE
ncbi:MAG TPA: cytochrome c-type biogenesis protein CcmH [Burkholderiales bacterium]|nr:cytochrome c-type biogenesis protein CcmH [Burkholderiales bacterium]